MIVILAIFVMSTVVGAFPPTPPTDLDWQHQINANYWLFWSHDSTDITIELHVAATGWVALGISPDALMANTDVISAWVNGGNFLQDRKATGRFNPPNDASQDVTLLSASEVGGATIVRFKRNIIASDSDDFTIEEGDINLLWAFNVNTDPSDETSLSYHGGNRGVLQLQLLRHAPDPSEDYQGNTVAMGDNCDLYWKKVDDIVTFEVICKTTGYIAVGISADGNMIGSDMVVAYYVDSQNIYQDRYASARSEPSIDSINDWTLQDLTEQDGYTRIKVSRDVTAGEVGSDNEIPPGTVHICWAFGDKPVSAASTTISYHGSNRGTVQVEIYQETVQPTVLQVSGPGHLRIFMNGELRAEKSSRWRYLVDVPVEEGDEVIAIRMTSFRERMEDKNLLGIFVGLPKGMNRPWKCVVEKESSWKSISFNDSSWPRAVIRKIKTSNNAWTYLSSSADRGRIIWAQNYRKGSTKAVFCRLQLNQE